MPEHQPPFEDWLLQLRQQLANDPSLTGKSGWGTVLSAWTASLQKPALGKGVSWKAVVLGLMVFGGTVSAAFLGTWFLPGSRAARPLLGTWECQSSIGSEVFKFRSTGEFAYFMEGTGSAMGNQFLRGKYQVRSRDDQLEILFETHRGPMGAVWRSEPQEGQAGFVMEPLTEFDGEPINAFYDRTLELVRVPDWVCARDQEVEEGLDINSAAPIVGYWLPKYAQDRPPFSFQSDGQVLGWSSGSSPGIVKYQISYAKYPFELDLIDSEGQIQRGIVDFPSRKFLRFNLENDPRKPRPQKFDAFGYWKRAETGIFPDAWDLRQSEEQSGNYYLVFVARDSSPGRAIPGHIYVAWVEESESQQMTLVDAWGFYPRENLDGINALKLIVSVPGAVVNEDTGLAFEVTGEAPPKHDTKLGLTSQLAVNRFAVRVSESDFRKSRDVINRWKANDYEFLNQNCKNFVHEVAQSIGLNVPEPKPIEAAVGLGEFPDEYIKKMKEAVAAQLQSVTPAQ